jgi:hypothetical protein
MKAPKSIFHLALVAAISVSLPGFVPSGMPFAEAQESSAPAAKRVIGAIKSISGNDLVLIPDSGSEIHVLVQDTTRILRVEPGEKNLKNATPIQLADLQVGDRILVGGTASADAKALLAASIVAMKHADVESLHQKQEQDWQKRGLGGVVDGVDSSTGTITLSQTGFTGKKIIAVHTSKDTVVRRYAPDSVKFEDAKPSTLQEIHPGDQLRARGNRNAEGTEISADEIVSGTFRNLAGTVNSVDASGGTLSVHDLLSKKNVEVKITADSQLRQLPPEMAQRIAMRLKRSAAGGAPSTRPASDASSTSGNAGESRPAQSQAGNADTPSGPRGAGMRPGGAPDFQQMLSRMPAVSLADLHKGEAVLVLTTAGAPGSEGTAITLLSGVEPILQAAPGGGQGTFLSPWNLGGAPGGDLANP